MRIKQCQLQVLFYSSYFKVFKANIKNEKLSLEDIFSKLSSKQAEKQEKGDKNENKNKKTKKIKKGFSIQYFYFIKIMI